MMVHLISRKQHITDPIPHLSIDSSAPEMIPSITSVSPPSFNPNIYKQRPRSSPTRLSQANSRYKPLSFSPSRDSCFLPVPKTQEMDDRLGQQLYAVESGEAYFSTRPPINPLRIVLLGKPLQDIPPESRAQRLVDNLKRIEGELDSGVGNTSGVLTDVTTFESESSCKGATCQMKPENVKHSFKIPVTTATREKNQSSAREMRLWLCQLIANLPIAAAVSTSQSSKHLQSPESTTPRMQLSIPSRSPGKVSPDRLSRCSIAVQALSRNVSEVSNYTVERNTELPDEWVGGVRAMRDSHVRLVLRQLRHIDRLNRALDRASRGVNNKRSFHKTQLTTKQIK